MADPYLTADAVRDRQPKVDGSDEQVERLVVEFEDLAERYRGVAFTPRVATSTRRCIRGVLELPDVMIREVTSVTVAGSPVAWSEDCLDAERGRLHLSASGLVTVVYGHGLDAPSEGLLAACAKFVRRELVVELSGTSRDVLSQAIDGAVVRYSTPNWDEGRPTGYLDIDARLNAERDYRLR